MKSVAIKGEKQFEIKDIKEPVSDKYNVIIDVKKAGICGSDIHYWVSGNPTGLVMGHEFCGIVTDPGSREDLKVGDRVTALPISPCGKCHACVRGDVQFCSKTWDKAVGLSLTNPGAYTSKTFIRPDMVIKVPKGVSDNEVAMVEPTAVAFHAVNLANVRVGNKVLVIGGGIIGLLSAMFAKKEGASLVVVSETNLERAKKSVDLGVADKYYNALDPKFMKHVLTDTTEGFDIVIDCCGNSPAVSTALTAVKTGGSVILVGVSLAPITVPTVVAVLHEIKVLGAIAYTKEEFQTCIDLIDKKQIEIEKFVDDVVSLEDVQKSFERLTSGTDSAVKILIDPSKK